MKVAIFGMKISKETIVGVTYRIPAILLNRMMVPQIENEASALVAFHSVGHFGKWPPGPYFWLYLHMYEM
jgi:hypothetical protein